MKPRTASGPLRAALGGLCLVACACACSQPATNTDAAVDAGHPLADAADDRVDATIPPADAANTDAPVAPRDVASDSADAATHVVPACTVHLGSGSGRVSIAHADAPDGAVVCLAAGTYSSGDFTGLNHVTVIPTGPVVFNGSIDIQHTNGLTVDGTVLPGVTYGFTFRGFDGFAVETGATNNTDLTLAGIHLDGVSGVDGNNQGNITYDGTPATLLFSNLVIDTVLLEHGVSLFAGTYQNIETFHNVVIGLTLRNVVAVNDPARQDIYASGNSVYHYLLENWHITGASLATMMDQGVFAFTGNGTVRNVYRNGGWGYVGRMVLAGLGTPGEFNAYNIVDVNGENYGVFDLRTATGGAYTPSNIVGGNAHLYNITTGNKLTANTYVSPVVIFYGFTDYTHANYHAEVKNCFVFDNQRDPTLYPTTSTTYVSFGTAVIDASHNVELDGPVGSLPSGYLVDETDFYPAPGSALIGAGTPEPMAATDLYGNPRSGSYDIGAVQHR